MAVSLILVTLHIYFRCNQKSPAPVIKSLPVNLLIWGVLYVFFLILESSPVPIRVRHWKPLEAEMELQLRNGSQLPAVTLPAHLGG